MRKIAFLLVVAVSIGFTAAVVADEKADKIDKAWKAAHALSAQVEVFKLNNGRYPKSIKELAQTQPNGAVPLVPEEVLKDPWGQLYEIDPKGPKSKGNKADVWSKGPSKNDPKGVIGNWHQVSPAKGGKPPRP